MFLSTFVNKFNRRKVKRFNIDMGATYAIKKFTKDVEGDGLVRNVSCLGVSIDACDKLRNRAYCMINLIKKELDINVTVGGRVIWARHINNITTCGIKIDWISNKENFEEYIRSLEVANGMY